MAGKPPYPPYPPNPPYPPLSGASGAAPYPPYPPLPPNPPDPPYPAQPPSAPPHGYPPPPSPGPVMPGPPIPGPVMPGPIPGPPIPGPVRPGPISPGPISPGPIGSTGSSGQPASSGSSASHGSSDAPAHSGSSGSHGAGSSSQSGSASGHSGSSGPTSSSGSSTSSGSRSQSGSSGRSGSGSASGSHPASGSGSGSSDHSGSGSGSHSSASGSGSGSGSGSAPPSGSSGPVPSGPGSSISSGTGSGYQLGSGSVVHTSTYDVEPISLPAVAGYHSGTGTFDREQLIVVPSSVPGSGNLAFQQASVHVTTRLYQIAQNIVPNWFGVAVPQGVTDFSHPIIYFHPSPGQAGYVDSDYPTKAGMWPDLFYYLELLGYQLDAAIKNFGAPPNQVVVMPFLTTHATDTGIFAPNWQGIVTDILTDVRNASGVSGSGPVEIQDLVLASFSVGYVYLEEFRLKAPGLSGLLKQVWDFDGYPKSDSSLLLTTSSVTAIKYDQAAEPGCYHLPLSRWADYPKPAPDPADWPAPANGSDVHRSIRDYMFLDAASRR